MGEDPFDRLLDAMPKIAEAVNAFTSPEVQRRSFDALLATLGATVDDQPDQSPADVQRVNGAAAARPATETADQVETPDPADTTAGPVTNGRTRRVARKSAGRKTWSASKDINFFPDGQQSLTEFAEEKKPAGIGEQNIVISYYLSERLGRATFSVSDVLAGFKACQWKEAANPNHSLRSIASRKMWLDTSNMNDIKLAHLGRRFVDHDLPRAAKT